MCHLPTAALRKAGGSSSGIVSSARGSSVGVFQKLVAPKPVRRECRPVSMPARVGGQIGLLQALRNSTPSAASASMTGVWPGSGTAA